MKFFHLLVLLFITFLVSCDEKRIFEENIDIDQKTWNEESVPSFEFRIDQPELSYNLYYNFRNTRAYPYHNLYVQYSMEDSVGQIVSSELHNIHLFDPKTGKPYGDGLGDIFDHQVLALENYRFDTSGLYRFKIKQFMRMANLPEIVSVGLRVEKAQ